MRRDYGLPYMGSKAKIAEGILTVMPSADWFVDLFCGGCAVTHAAMMIGRWKNVLVNDVQSDIPQMFVDAINGKYRDERRWISREDFFALKDTDAYVRTCWSFGNRQDSYLYSQEVEHWKKALHYARVFGDCSLFRDFGIDTDGSRADIIKHQSEYKEKYIVWYCANILHSELDTAELRRNLEENIKRESEELRQYLVTALKASGLTQAEVGRRLGTQMEGHYFGRSQWEFPTREYYIQMQEFMPLPIPYEEIYGLQSLMQSLQSLESLESLQSLQSLQSLESLQRLQRLQSLESLQRLQRLQSLQRLQRLQRLQSLQRLQRLQITPTVSAKSYDEVEIHDNAVVYCDPPYNNCADYGVDFDHPKFCEWARTRDYPVYISEYKMPDDFTPIWEVRHRSILSATANNAVTERLFVHRKWAERIWKPTLF